AFDGSFRVENRFHFTDLAECRFVAEWVNVSAPGEPIQETILEKEDLAVRMPPGHSGTIQLTLPGAWHTMDLLRISVTDPHGRLVNTFSWPLKTASAKNAELIQSAATNPVVEESTDGWRVHAGTIDYTFDKQQGLLTEVTKEGKHI